MPLMNNIIRSCLLQHIVALFVMMTQSHIFVLHLYSSIARHDMWTSLCVYVNGYIFFFDYVHRRHHETQKLIPAAFLAYFCFHILWKNFHKFVRHLSKSGVRRTNCVCIFTRPQQTIVDYMIFCLFVLSVILYLWKIRYLTAFRASKAWRFQESSHHILFSFGKTRFEHAFETFEQFRWTWRDYNLTHKRKIIPRAIEQIECDV